jgi:SnoaL-like domain
MTLEGKGFFTWKIPSCEHGDPGSIAAQAKSAGLSHLVVKVADGTMIYNGTWGDPKDYTTPVINALRALGIQVWGWHYVYGDNPAGEASVAIARIRQYNLDGYVIDAEKEYKDSGKKAAAKRFMTQLKTACPDLEIALSSYRYPSLHPQIPWAEFLELCTINMPQVYWIKAHNPGDQLVKTVREFQGMKFSRLVIPTGAASKESGWQPNEKEILEFIRTAKELNLTAVNFWEWSDARSGNLPGVWEAIRDYPWSGVAAPKDICANYIGALNSHDVEQVLSLYTPAAVHINALRTIQGLENMRTWYNQLFNEILPNGKFSLTGYSGSGNSRHMTWTASSTKGLVQNGNDTFGLASGKINYHYSFFTVAK